MHALLLVVHRFFREFCKTQPRLDTLLQTWLGTLFRIALTFFSVCICWVFFQPSLDRAVLILQRMFLVEPGLGTPVSTHQLKLLVAILGLAHLLVAGGFWVRLARRLPAPCLVPPTV